MTQAEFTQEVAANITLSSLTLDELFTFSPHSLETLYQRAATPRLVDLEGSFHGTFLASSLELKAPFAWLCKVRRNFASSWRSTRIHLLSPNKAHGSHHFFKRNVMEFDITLQNSRSGHFSAAELRYKNILHLPVEVRFLDEIRQLHQDLFLGRGYLLVGNTTFFLCFFGLARHPN